MSDIVAEKAIYEYAEKAGRLRGNLEAVLGPGLLGSQSDEEIERDYGALGLSIVKSARQALRELEKSQ